MKKPGLFIALILMFCVLSPVTVFAQRKITIKMASLVP